MPEESPKTETTEPRLCLCGCGISMPYPEVLWDQHYDAVGKCRLCGNSCFSSRALKNAVVDRHGEEIPCPLCHLIVVTSQLERHGQMLGELKQALLEPLPDESESRNQYVPPPAKDHYGG